jgi:SAM-dependent methyltransferase
MTEAGRSLEAEVESFFDRSSQEYDGGYARHDSAGRVLRRRAALAAELLGDDAGTVLDVGMGAGVLCAELDRRGWAVSGVDLSPAMVEAARRRLPHLAERLARASIHELPFTDESFDAVVATGVVEYAVDDLEGAIGELARVLRTRGRAVISFPNQRAPVTLWRAQVLYPTVRAAKSVVRFGRPAPPRVPTLGLGEFERAVADAGLEIERVEPVGALPLPSGAARRLEDGRSRLAFALAVQRIYLTRKRP